MQQRQIVGLILLGAAIVLWVSVPILLVRLREHRIDIPPRASWNEGKSRIWQVNVLTPSNYDPKGRKLLPWFWIVQVVWVLCLAGAMVLGFGTG